MRRRVLLFAPGSFEPLSLWADVDAEAGTARLVRGRPDDLARGWDVECEGRRWAVLAVDDGLMTLGAN